MKARRPSRIRRDPVRRGTALRFGIVGLGNIAAFHAQAARALKGGVLHSCFSRAPKKAQAFAHKHGCRPFFDYRAFLADPALDIVTICTPSGAHLDPALAAARAGKHLIVEKPLEITPARCRRIMAACRAAGVKLVTVYPSRFQDVSRAMKAAVEKRRLGSLVSGSAYVKWFRPQRYYDTRAWCRTWGASGGGALMNQGIHSVDLLLWLMGDPVRVAAFMSRPTRRGIEVETNVVAALEFPGGALGVIEASTEVFPGYPKRIEICGAHGAIAASEEELARWDFEAARPGDAGILRKFVKKSGASGGSSDPLAISYEGHRRQFQELVDVLQGRKRALTCDGAEGLRSVRVVCAIYESARTGRPIRLR